VRDWFIDELNALPIVEQVYATATNFVLVRSIPGIDIFARLQQKGIVTRNQSHEPALARCVRITIGTRQSMQEVIDILRQCAA